VKLIVGLGNPGPRYEGTRHNVGFTAVTELAKRWNADGAKYDKHFEALIVEASAAGSRVLLLAPQTFMNLSGRSVSAVQRFYKLATGDVLAIYDDGDLPVGAIRVRADGSAGGQKGMEDILRRLGSTAVPRIRIGIGRAPSPLMSEWVLSRFSPAERPAIEEALGLACDACECWVREGITAAMNKFNRREKKKPRPDGPDSGGSAAPQGETP